jgi:tryptophanyl-tRNA synthetase
LNNEQKNLLSCIQPTGTPTLGNYLGALKNWAQMAQGFNSFFAVADLHAITVKQEPAQLRAHTRELYALLMAIGLDPQNLTLFVQSHVPEHSQLAWILGCYTQFGELSRMTQFKDKSAAHADNINVGLFSYPALMAADILLYDAAYVPVGADQKQHLEITRDIANRFNGIYGDVFVIPEPYIGKEGARVMSLQDPSKKMSKSDINQNAYILMTDDSDTIMRKLKRTVTDSIGVVRYSDEQPGIKNLLDIYCCCTKKSQAEAEREFEGLGYGVFKEAVAVAVATELEPIQKRYYELLLDKTTIDLNMKSGAEKAHYAARRVLSKVVKKVGFLQV